MPVNTYLLKRNLAAAVGLLDWKWRRLPAGLYIYNFHRIGDSGETPFDPNVFSATAEQFTRQLQALSARFRVIGIDDLRKLVESGKQPDEPMALITFDDGYVDNYTVACPILRSLDLPAVFFLPTDFIGNQALPWWEEAAWIVRNTSRASLTLPGLDTPVVIDGARMEMSIRQVLRYFKDYPGSSLDEKMVELKEQCQVAPDPAAAANLFLDWDQVRKMRDLGMAIGSHTCSHRILSQLRLDEQEQELAESKRIIEAAIGDEVMSLAYPVGGVETFTAATRQMAEQCGYRLAFSFPVGGGASRNPAGCPLALPRISLDLLHQLPDIQYATVYSRIS